MGMSLLRAGMVGLALVAAAGAAGAESKKKGVVNDIPDVVIQDPALRDTEIRQFLAGGRDLSRLKLPRLQQRLHRAESFRDVPNLPPELDQALQQEVARIAQEIVRREQAESAPPPPAPEGQQQAEEPKIEDPPLPPYDPQPRRRPRPRPLLPPRPLSKPARSPPVSTVPRPLPRRKSWSAATANWPASTWTSAPPTARPARPRPIPRRCRPTSCNG